MVLAHKFAQVFQASGGLLGCAAFDAEDNVSRAFVLDGFDDPVPVQDAFTTGATDGRACYLAAFRIGVF